MPEGLLLDLWKWRAGWSRRQEPPRVPPFPLGPSSGFLTASSSISCSQELATAPCASTPSALTLWIRHPPAPNGPWDTLFPFPPDDTPWHLLPQGGRGRRQTSSWKHSGGVLQQGCGHGGGRRAMSKPGNPRTNIILLVASRMGKGPAPQGARPCRTKRMELFMED